MHRGAVKLWYRYVICRYFFLYPFVDVHQSTKIWHFVEPRFVFSFVACALVSHLRGLCLTEGHKDLSLYFKSFTVLSFYILVFDLFRVHFFFDMVRKKVQLHSFACGYLVVPVVKKKDNSFFIGILLKIHWP